MKSQYLDAVQAIHNFIASQKLRPGARLPSSRLLAEHLGFLRKTTDRACQHMITRGILIRNGYKLLVGTETPARQSIEGVVYVASYLEPFSRAVGRILAERGVNHRRMELTSIKHNNPLPVLRKILAEKPAGVIFWRSSWIEGLESVAGQCNIPIVICADGAPDVDLSTAQTDWFRGMEKALMHLFSLGHRHIALVSGNKASTFDLALASAYRTVCERLGLKQSASLIWQADSLHNEVMRNMMLERRRSSPDVTALIVGQYGCIEATEIFSVPEEVSIVSIMGSDNLSKRKPPLTTVSLRDSDDCIASWACSEIIAQIQARESGRPKRPPRHAFFAPELIIGGSTRDLTKEQGDFFDIGTVDRDLVL